MALNKSTQTSLVEECDGVNQEWALMRGAQELREDGVLVDVVLIVDGVKMSPCHKFVLAASSPYFRAMFSHGMVEQDKNEIEIKGVDVDSLTLVLNYLYTARIVICDDNVQSLITTCSLLQIPGLYGKCRDYMIRRLDISNCLSVYRFARSLCCTKLEDESFRIIAKRISDIIGTPEFLSLGKKELIDVISSDELWVTEEEVVYEAVLLWISFDIAERSRVIAEVFSHIRFSLMKEKYLDSCIMEEELILTFPQLLAQVQAAKSYLVRSQLDPTVPGQDDPISARKSSDNTENEDENHTGAPNVKELQSASPSVEELPFYEVPVEGADRLVRIPLNITPRAGMSTKEFLLFTNGRKTFVTNPQSATEYYGCVDGKPSKDSNLPASYQSNTVQGWAPHIPLMKNPEAYSATYGTTYLLGGLEVEKSPSTNIRTRVYALEPDKLEWAACASLPVPRCMASYGDGCGRLYVLGGKAISLGEVISTVHRYDRIEDQWEEVNPMPMAIYGHSSASLRDMIYIMGGKTASKELLSNVYQMDCNTHQYTELESLSVPRFLHGTTIHTRLDEIFVVGGSSKDGVLGSVEVYSLSDGRWRFGESFPGNRCAQFALCLNDEIHSVGGYVTERNQSGTYESREMHDIFVLDSKDGQWKRSVRRVRGTTSCSLACVKVRLNMSKVPRAPMAFD